MARPATRHPVQPHARIVLKAVKRCGSQQALAETLNRRIRRHRLNARPVVQQNISNWIRRDRKIAEPYKTLLREIVNDRHTR